jgi:hypothetical protein
MSVSSLPKTDRKPCDPIPAAFVVERSDYIEAGGVVSYASHDREITWMDLERRQARRSPDRAADKVRVDPSEDGYTDRPDDSGRMCWRGLTG